MADDLDGEERLELLSRRIREDVSRSVEDQLRRRYSWIGIVTAFVLGGLGYGIVTTVVRDAADSVIIAKVTAERAKEEVDRVEDTLAELRKTTDAARRAMQDDAASFRAGIEKDLEGLRSRVVEIDTLLAARRQDLANLGTVATELQDLGRQVQALGERVDMIAVDLPAADRTDDVRTSEAAAPAESAAPMRVDIARQYAVIEEVKRQVEAARTSVFLQYGGVVSPELASAVAEELWAAGYVVHGTERVANPSRGHEVRYFHAEDATGAAALAGATAGILAGRGVDATVVTRDLTGWTRTKPRQGTVELWLGG